MGPREDATSHRLGKLERVTKGGNYQSKLSHASACAQVHANTPESVFQLLAYLKELLLLLHQNYILPALAYLSALLHRAWISLQDSCKSVPRFY